jgi:hypothetical protein
MGVNNNKNNIKFMKMQFYIFILCFIIISCSEKKTDLNLFFDTIDYSYCNDNEYYSIKINRDGTIFISEETRRIDLSDEKYIKEGVFIQTILSSVDIDSLSTLVMRINHLDLDTLHERNCADCEIHNLIINKQSEYINLFMVDTNDDNLTEVINLFDYLSFLRRKMIVESKSVEFKTKIPTPPPLLKR